MSSDSNDDNNKPVSRRAVKRRMFGRATFNHEGRRIRKSGHAFPDAGRITNKRFRCTRRLSKVDDGAEGWRTAVRFFNDSAYFERRSFLVEASDRVTRDHFKAWRPV